MPTIYRIFRDVAGRDPLRPAAERGRWHVEGQAVLYAADSWATAALEILAGLNGCAPKSPDHLVLAFDVPDALVYTLPPGTLEAGWYALDSYDAAQHSVKRWHEDDALPPVLRVPSVAASCQGFTFVMRRHDPRLQPIFEACTAVRFRFDERLFRSLTGS